MLIGCSKTDVPGKSQDKGDENKGDKQVTITVWDYYGATTPIEPLISKFESENPTIKVEFQSQPWDNYWEKLAAGAAGGELPDVATTGLMWDPKYSILGVYADINELSGGKINDDTIQDVFSKGMLDAATTDKGLFGVPYDFDSYSLYYRDDLLKEEGLTGPPTNWSEMVEFGKKLTKDLDGDGKTDQYAFLVLPDWYHFEPFLYANGGDVLNADNTKAVFNSPEGVEALQFYSDLVNKHKVAVNWTPDQGTYVTGLKDGTIAMFQDGPYVMGLIKNSIPEHDGKWKIGSSLSNKQFGTHIGGTYLSVFEQSKYKEEAWKFIEFLSKEENATEVYTVSGAAPGYLPALESEKVNKPDPFFGDQVTLTEFKIAVEKGKSNPVVGDWMEISSIISDAVTEAILLEKTPQEALDIAAKKVDELLSK